MRARLNSICGWDWESNLGWMNGMAIIGHGSAKSTFGAKDILPTSYSHGYHNVTK